MLRIEYDRVQGTAIKDGEAHAVAQALVQQHHEQPEQILYRMVANDNIIYALRVLARKGEISPDDVVFIYDNTEIRVYKSGGIYPCPHGFMDFADMCIQELL